MHLKSLIMRRMMPSPTPIRNEIPKQGPRGTAEQQCAMTVSASGSHAVLPGRLYIAMKS